MLTSGSTFADALPPPRAHETIEIGSVGPLPAQPHNLDVGIETSLPPIYRRQITGPGLCTCEIPQYPQASF